MTSLGAILNVVFILISILAVVTVSEEAIMVLALFVLFDCHVCCCPFLLKSFILGHLWLAGCRLIVKFIGTVIAVIIDAFDVANVLTFTVDTAAIVIMVSWSSSSHSPGTHPHIVRGSI